LRDTTRFGQLERSTGAFEQRAPKGSLERTDLRAERRVREPKLARGAF